MGIFDFIGGAGQRIGNILGGVGSAAGNIAGGVASEIGKGAGGIAGVIGEGAQRFARGVQDYYMPNRELNNVRAMQELMKTAQFLIDQGAPPEKVRNMLSKLTQNPDMLSILPDLKPQSQGVFGGLSDNLEISSINVGPDGKPRVNYKPKKQPTETEIIQEIVKLQEIEPSSEATKKLQENRINALKQQLAEMQGGKIVSTPEEEIPFGTKGNFWGIDKPATEEFVPNKEMKPLPTAKKSNLEMQQLPTQQEQQVKPSELKEQISKIKDKSGKRVGGIKASKYIKDYPVISGSLSELGEEASAYIIDLMEQGIPEADILKFFENTNG